MEAVARSALVCPQAACAPVQKVTLKKVSSSAVSFVGSRNNAVAAKVPSQRGSVARRPVVCMAKESAATGYASALIELGTSTKSLDAIHADLEALSSVTGDADSMAFFANPVVADDAKKKVVKSLASELKLNSYTVNFLNLLIDRRRIDILNLISLSFEEMYCEVSDTQVAVVTSAVKLENSQQALIAKKLQSMTGAKNIKLKNIIDPSLIAGFIVKYGKDGSEMIDMSVKGQLDRLAEQLDLNETKLMAA